MKRIPPLSTLPNPASEGFHRLARLNEIRYLRDVVDIKFIDQPPYRKFYGSVPPPMELNPLDMALLCSEDDVPHGADVFTDGSTFLCIVKQHD